MTAYDTMIRNLCDDLSRRKIPSLSEIVRPRPDALDRLLADVTGEPWRCVCGNQNAHGGLVCLCCTRKRPDAIAPIVFTDPKMQADRAYWDELYDGERFDGLS